MVKSRNRRPCSPSPVSVLRNGRKRSESPDMIYATVLTFSDRNSIRVRLCMNVDCYPLQLCNDLDNTLPEVEGFASPTAVLRLRANPIGILLCSRSTVDGCNSLTAWFAFRNRCAGKQRNYHDQPHAESQCRRPMIRRQSTRRGTRSSAGRSIPEARRTYRNATVHP